MILIIFFININLNPKIEKLLFNYKVFHIFNLANSFENNNTILEWLDTGTGKTYTAITLCKNLGFEPFIICPKTLINHWINICRIFDVVSIGIPNYEIIKTGYMYDMNMRLIKCNFLDINKNNNKKGKNRIKMEI